MLPRDARPSPAAAAPQTLRWDLFCRVVDNLGDIGTCWRLAAQLAAHGDVVRLVVDDASALAWMAPAQAHAAGDAPPITVHAWPAAGEVPPGPPAEVVVEAFGCNLPDACVQAMRASDPVWINLEYLSAEPYVERSHGLPSPRADGLRKWFFYPGFTPATGGLLRERGLMARRDTFDRDAWLAAQGWPRWPGERVVCLFCYEGAPLRALLEALAAAPTLLLATPGPAQQALRAVAADAAPGAGAAPLRVAQLPWLSQFEFDHLLWAADLNLVRGEDSLVRALWAGGPFLWQLYPQQDGAHAAKLRAFVDWLAPPPAVAEALAWWNGLAAAPASLSTILPADRPPAQEPSAASPGTAWHAAVRAARSRLLAQEDLVAQLRRFVLARLRPARLPG